MLDLPPGDEEQFTFREVERRTQGFKHSLLTAERGAKPQCLVWKGLNMFGFFLGKNHWQRIALLCITRKTCNRLRIHSASDERLVRLRAER
jgi:hypothetical protein